ncbi:Hypothetical protein DHA2_3202, partial [Giardia duodenalis]
VIIWKNKLHVLELQRRLKISSYRTEQGAVFMRLPREVQRLKDALMDDFKQKYQDVVTRLAFELYVPLRPRQGTLTDTQKEQIKAFAQKFGSVFTEIADSMLGKTDDLAEIVPFKKWH